MMSNLIQEGGWRWSDFDDITDDELIDLLNAKANLKRAKKELDKKPVGGDPDHSMELFLKNSGLL